MKKWWLLLSLGVCLPAFADNQNKSCEFLAEGGVLSDNDFIDFSEGSVYVGSCEEDLFVYHQKDDFHHGFVDKYGNIVFQAQFPILSIKPFSDGVSIIKTYEGTGLVNSKAEWVLKPKYNDIYDFKNGYAIAVKYFDNELHSALIDNTGREVIALDKGMLLNLYLEKSSDKYIRVVVDKNNDNSILSAVQNKNGVFLIPMDIQTIDFDDIGIGKICQPIKNCIYINEKLDYITNWGYDDYNAKYGDSLNVGDGLIMVKKNNKYGYINTYGQEVIAPIYDSATRFSHGVAVVQLNGDYFLIDKNNQKISKNYTGIIQLQDSDFYIVKKENKYGVINHKEQQIVPIAYDNIGGNLFADELVEFSQNEQWGLMNLSGKIMVAPQYERTNYYKDGLIAVKKNGKWGFVDKDNRTVIDFEYDDPLIDEQEYYKLRDAYAVNYDKIAVVKNGKWGVIDTTGKVVADFIYDGFDYIVEQYVVVTKDGEQVWIEFELPTQ